jgi:hypothetical protein
MNVRKRVYLAEKAGEVFIPQDDRERRVYELIKARQEDDWVTAQARWKWARYGEETVPRDKEEAALLAQLKAGHLPEPTPSTQPSTAVTEGPHPFACLDIHRPTRPDRVPVFNLPRLLGPEMVAEIRSKVPAGGADVEWLLVMRKNTTMRLLELLWGLEGYLAEYDALGNAVMPATDEEGVEEKQNKKDIHVKDRKPVELEEPGQEAVEEKEPMNTVVRRYRSKPLEKKT